MAMNEGVPGSAPPGQVPLLMSGVTPAEALARRSEAAAARNEALRQLKAGEIDVHGLVVLGAVDDDVAGILLAKVLTTLGMGRSDAERALAKIGIRANRRVQWFFTRDGGHHLAEFLRLVEQPGRPRLAIDWFYR